MTNEEKRSFSALENISPIDGRYANKTEELKKYFSEYALIKFRTQVEIEWVLHLLQNGILGEGKKLTEQDIQNLREIYHNFDTNAANEVKEIENTTNHDVKAVEYYIRKQVKALDIPSVSEYIHFACTSEDINNLAYALILQGALTDILIPELIKIRNKLFEKALEEKGTSMPGHTHGQLATPTTLGKEIVNFVARLDTQITKLENAKTLGKLNGAVGNFNAQALVFPEQDWIKISEDFVNQLGLEFNKYSTQIEPHDYISEISNTLQLIQTILLDLCKDIWTYISMGYLSQKIKKTEVGSSIMPHKVNPIDFENAEGNLGISNALLNHFSQKLPISRMQRDLSDSTVLRNMGTAFAHGLIAYKSILKGLEKISGNQEKTKKELEENYQLLGEAIQMMLKKYGDDSSYEKLKDLSRGKKISKEEMQNFINSLEIPDSEKKRLSELQPSQYTGYAEKLVEDYPLRIRNQK